MLNCKSLKDVLANNLIKIVIITLFIIAIIVTLIFYPYEKTSKIEKTLIDDSRINQIINFNNKDIYSSFSFSFDESNKNAITYFSKNTSFLSADFSNKNSYKYRFQINEFKDFKIEISVKKETNLPIDVFALTQGNDAEYIRVNDDLIYKKTSTATSKIFNFIRLFKYNDKDTMITYRSVVSNRAINTFNYDHIIETICSSIDDFSVDDKETPYLCDKICFINLSNYSLNSYKLINKINESGITLVNGANEYLLEINTNYDNLNIYDNFIEKNKENNIKDCENLYFDAQNNAIVFTDSMNFARIFCDNSNKSVCLEFIKQYFKKEV